MKFITIFLRIAVLYALVAGLPPAIAFAQALPSVIQEEENPVPFYGTWTLDGQVYNAVWNNGALATLTVQSFTPASVIINRTDIPGSVSYGMTAVYTGQISSAGNSILNGSVTWTWPGHYGYPATGSWSAYWSLPTPQITFVDPVPQLIRSGAVIPTGDPDDDNLLATLGRVVGGVAADGVTELLIRISGINVGDQLTLSLTGDDLTGSTNDDGALGVPGDPNFPSENVTVTAVNTSQGPMAFAVYRAPIDFPRPTKNQDKGAASRAVSIQVQPPSGGAINATVAILRPPVVLVHGVWSSAKETWEAFCPLYSACANRDTRFSVSEVDYSYVVKQIQQETIKANALGFAFNAPDVLSQLRNAVQLFKYGNNPAGIQTAAVQADVVAHSMGGDITRTIALPNNPRYSFYVDLNFKSGDVHKLITIDTPHLGTPVAKQLLDPRNACVARIVTNHGSSVISTIFIDGQDVTGAVYDLSGDGHGVVLSAALARLKQQGVAHLLPVAMISAEEDEINLETLDTCWACVARIARTVFWCEMAPLTQYMRSKLWQGVFSDNFYHSPGDDALVSYASQVNNETSEPQFIFSGLIHSPGTESLGFQQPTVLTDGGLVPNAVIGILNTPITDISVFIPTTP